MNIWTTKSFTPEFYHTRNIDPKCSHISINMNMVTGVKGPACGAAPTTNTSANPMSSTEIFPFMELPTEIRILIYKIVLFCDGRAGCTFCPTKDHTDIEISHELFSHPAILRTCISIYNEALPVFYIDNVFELLCNVYHEGLQRVWYRTKGPSPLIPCPNVCASTYLKQGLLVYPGCSSTCSTPFILEYPQCWPQIEREVLELYPNIESIFLRSELEDIHLLASAPVCFKLVRSHQIKHGVWEHESGYEVNVDIPPDHEEPRTRRIWDKFRDLCSTIWDSEIHGEMQKTTFAVHAMRLGRRNSLSNTFPNPMWEDLDLHEIYMG